MDKLNIFNKTDSLTKLPKILEKFGDFNDQLNSNKQETYSYDDHEVNTSNENLYIQNGYDLSTDIVDGTSTMSHAHAYSSRFLFYFIIAFCVISLTLAIVFLVVYILKRAKLNRLRHHLMPLYKFDHADDEPQADLLQDDWDQQARKSAGHLKLKFSASNSLDRHHV